MSDDERGPSNAPVIWILVVLGGIFLLLVVACGGLGYLGLRAWNQAMQGVQSAMAEFQQLAADMQLAETVAHRFLEDVGAGRLDLAYQATSKEYRARQTMDEFRAFVDKHPRLKEPTSIQPQPTNPSQAVMTFQARVTNAKGETMVTLQLIKQAQVWKVDRFTVP